MEYPQLSEICQKSEELTDPSSFSYKHCKRGFPTTSSITNGNNSVKPFPPIYSLLPAC